MAVIFVSYAREDRERVAEIAGALEEYGWTVWWDRHIPPGRTFDEVIEEALDAADAVIAAWSEHGVASRWVRTEAAEGLARDILLPVMLEEDVRIPLAFRRIHSADLSDWEPGREHVGFDELVEALESLIGSGRSADVAAAPEPEPVTETTSEMPATDSIAAAAGLVRERAADQDWAGVLDAVAAVPGGAEAVSSADPDVGDAIDEARRQRDAAELYDEAEVLYGEGRWDDVLAKLDQAQELGGEQHGIGGLAAKAQGHLDRERREREFDSDHARAQAALASGEWAVAVARLERLLDEEPDHEEAAAELASARERLEAERTERPAALTTSAEADTTTDTTTDTVTGVEQPPTGRAIRWWPWVAITAVTALVAGLIVVSTRGGGGDEGATPTIAESATPAEQTSPDEAVQQPEDEPVGASRFPADFGGRHIALWTSEDANAVAGIQEALGVFNERYNADAVVSGVEDAGFFDQLIAELEVGTQPDIAILRVPTELGELADRGAIVPLIDEVSVAMDEFWDESYQLPGRTRDGVQYGVPATVDVKSLVWYVPARFEEDGYRVPETYDEFIALVDRIATAGGAKPLCVGIESGPLTGWVLTDWVEEIVLRRFGSEVYDQWVRHDIPFDDPRITEAMHTVLDLWNDENVFPSTAAIAESSFLDDPHRLVDGDCYMMRQASFAASFFPPGTRFADGSPNAVDAFYFPAVDGGRPVLTTGRIAAAFNDDPAVMRLMEFMATTEWADLRQRAQVELTDEEITGFLSAARGQNPEVYGTLEWKFYDIAVSADVARFDASDQMPGEVGLGTFLSEGTAALNGEIDAATATANIESSWPR